MRTALTDELVRFERARRVRRRLAPLSGRYRRDESVTRPRHGLDVGRRPAGVAERFAQRRDVHGEDPFLDKCVGPDFREQRVLGDESPGVPHERHQQIVRLGREMHGRAAAHQAPLRRIEAEVAECIARPIGHEGLGES